MKDVGTLKELDVKPGDVVQCVRWIGDFYSKGRHYKVVDGFGVSGKSIGTMDGGGNWRIISRASDKPKLWRDMTDAEKGALLLAAHDGSEIEVFNDNWGYWCCSRFKDNEAYRIRPEPKVETVTIYGSPSKHVQWCLEQCGLDTHRITFNLVNGKPDCASIKMEAL